MGGWWLELRQKKQVEEHGRRVMRGAGEWVCVGKQLAQEWIKEGAAFIPDNEPTGVMPADSGVLFLGGRTDRGQAVIEYYGDALMWQEGDEPFLPWPRTLIWSPGFRLRTGLILNGFGLLKRWQMAVPLWKYDELALRFGDAEERERTKEIVHDLRVMVYDTGCVFVRRCADTEKLIEMWAAERGKGSDKLAFLRALYTVKPLICALPISWGSEGDQ